MSRAPPATVMSKKRKQAKKPQKDGWSTSITIEWDGEVNPFILDFLQWWDSPEGEIIEEILEITTPLLKTMHVDARHRKLIWANGDRLSIDEAARRIHQQHPDLPLDLIEERVIGWLDMGYVPDDCSRDQIDELDRLTEEWIADYVDSRPPRLNGPRTPHS